MNVHARRNDVFEALEVAVGIEGSPGLYTKAELRFPASGCDNPDAYVLAMPVLPGEPVDDIHLVRAIDIDELDVKACLRRVTHEIRSSQTNIKGMHVYTIYRRRQFARGSVIETASPPITLYIDAAAPRKRLGGKCIYDLFNSYETGEVVPRVKFRA